MLILADIAYGIKVTLPKRKRVIVIQISSFEIKLRLLQ